MFDRMVRESVKQLIFEVVKNPLLHFSEKSLQVRLAAKLLTHPELSTPIQTGIYERYGRQIRRLGSTKSYLDDALSVPPLQMEYGTNDSGPYRIDIAILDPTEIRSIDDWRLQARRRYLDPQVGIEIGTEKSGMRKMSGEHLENDAFKLRNCRTAYVLNVLRNTNVCAKGTDTYLNKTAQIQKFTDGLQTVASKHSQINWIGLIIHIAYQEVQFFGGGGEWRSYRVPSREFERAVNGKL